MELPINEDFEWTVKQEKDLTQLRADYEDLDSLNPVDINRYLSTAGFSIRSAAEHFKVSLRLDTDIQIITQYISLILKKMYKIKEDPYDENHVVQFVNGKIEPVHSGKE